MDWQNIEPEKRAWMYLERYKGYWYQQCRARCNNWNDAEDLFSEAIALKVVKLSRFYNPIYGLAFTTFMSYALVKELNKVYQKTARRNRKVRIAYKNPEAVDNILGGQRSRGWTCSYSEVQEAMELLQEHDPEIALVFEKHVLHREPQNTLALKYRTSPAKIRSMVEEALKFLRNKLGHDSDV